MSPARSTASDADRSDPPSAGPRGPASLPLLAVSVGFFLAATVVGVREGSGGGGPLPLWFPLAVCGGITFAAGLTLLVFSGDTAPPEDPSGGPARTDDGERRLAAGADPGVSVPLGPAEVTGPNDPIDRAYVAELPGTALRVPVGGSAALLPPGGAWPDAPELLAPGSVEPDRGPSRPAVAPTLGPEPSGPEISGAATVATGLPGSDRSSARRIPSDPVHMELGEFVQALQARVGPPRAPSGGPGANVESGAASPSPPQAAGGAPQPVDPTHPRCVECGTAVPAFPAPGRCPACGRPMCDRCQATSVGLGAFGRCRDCRSLPAPLPAPA